LTGGGGCHFQFTASTDSGGSNVVRYLLRVADNPAATGAVVYSGSGIFDPPGLLPGKQYWFWGATGSQAGVYGAWSAPTTATMLAGGKVRVGSTWKPAVVKVRVGGVWKDGLVKVRSGGAWKDAI
jgi:hypothetical protein